MVLLGVLLTCYNARVTSVEYNKVPEKAYVFTFAELGSFLGFCASPRISVPSLLRASTDALIMAGTYLTSSPEEGHLLTESSRDVTFYSSHLLYLHKPNPWCLRMANPEPLPQRATPGDCEVKNRCWSHGPREWSAATPPSPLPMHIFFSVLVSSWVKK